MRTMLLIAGICVPLMLFVKPFYVKFTTKPKSKEFSKIDAEETEMVNINSSNV
jgi:hypothetical protein